jgi:two-component system CheB/CheR fusion protein
MILKVIIGGQWTGYAGAVAFTALAALLRWAQPQALTHTPYLAFYPAVVAAAALGGLGPGLLSTVGSFLCVELLFGATPGRVDFGDPIVLERMAILLAGGIGISLVSEMRRATRARERRQARELDERRDELHWVVESAPNGFVMTDAEGRIIMVNTRTEKLLGYPREELIGQPVEILVPDRFRAQHGKDRRQFMGNPETRPMGAGRDLWARRKDGSEVPVEIGLSPIRTHCGMRILASVIDISQRKQAQEALVAARDSAERAKAAAELANRTKDHFLAVLSHELRTPLTPVEMGVSMLQDRPDLDPRVRETLEMIRRNVDMEARLIDDLLDVTRIARGKIELHRSTVELSTIIQRAVEVCKPDIEAHNLHFSVDMGLGPAYWLDADVSRLQQVFWNLLKNAVKFTPHGGCLGIRVRKDEAGGLKDDVLRMKDGGYPSSFVLVEVSDSGIGIDPEAQPRIFNAFEQAERSIARQFGGLGLGLAICKTLVEMHGGTIEAWSGGRNQGATFRIRLPLCEPACRPEDSAPVPCAQRAVRPLRILLVEDHGVTAKMMRWVLTEEGHDLKTAGDVATALELAEQYEFDLLVSDLGLPDGSGHDLMRQLRQRGHRFPGIALSGYGQEEDIRRSHEAGFISHLTKPASRERLVEAAASVAAKMVAG